MRISYAGVFYISKILSGTALENSNYRILLACLAIILIFVVLKITGFKSSSEDRFHKDLSKHIEKNPQKEISVLVFEIENSNEIHRCLGNKDENEAARYVSEMAKDFFQGYMNYSIFYNEIAIGLSGVNVNDAYGLVEKFIEKFEKPVRLDNTTLMFNLHCGIVNYPNHGKTSHDIFNKMGRTLLKSRSNRRNISVYDSEIDARVKNDYKILNSIYKAIENEELRLVYHPKIDIVRNEVAGVEALLRWDNHSNINIAEFIRVSENVGYITDISKAVVSLALRQMEEWHSDGIDINVSINISPLDLKNEELYKHLSDCLANSDINPERLELEITERSIYIEEKKVSYLLNCFHELGLKISMDDFGTGYNSLKNILEFPFDIIKIDKYFIDSVEEYKTRAMVGSIISAAKKMGRTVVAEGVENEAQVNILRELGCSIIQGYYYSKPLDPEAFKKYYYEYGNVQIKKVI
jgi:EAL domain-containing protein (putative c-di-GMP-specific phosphodiesterase class I)/GGDEF domain-containing protein